jgi:RNA polymerase sigma factor (sigma-70 family)
MAYARKTMVRLSVDDRRRQWRRLRLQRSIESTYISGGTFPVRDDGIDPEILDAWRTLSPNQRTCLALRYLDDCSFEEIGSLVGCSPGTVRSHVSRGIDRMRAAVGHNGENVDMETRDG